MNNPDISKVMIDLCQLDIDAVGAYDIALKHIDDPKIHQDINRFKQDHVKHISELSTMIKQYDGKPPKETPDLKGYLISAMTSIRSSLGLLSALKAMESNEKTTNKNYKTALEKNPNLPSDVKLLLQKNLGDEKTHLQYIQNIIPEVELRNK